MSFWDYLATHDIGGGIVIATACITAIVCCELLGQRVVSK